MTISGNFVIGDLVEVRDANIKTWREGIVAQVEPKLLVKCEGWCALQFDHVRQCASKPPTHTKPAWIKSTKQPVSAKQQPLRKPPIQKTSPKQQPVLAPTKQPVSAPIDTKPAAPLTKPQSQNLLYYNPSPTAYYYVPQVSYYYQQQYQQYCQQYYSNTFVNNSSQFYPSYNSCYVPQETQVPQFHSYQQEPESKPTPPEVTEVKIESNKPVQTILGDTNFKLPQWVKPIFPESRMAS